jgi:hypothetical protein
VSQELWNLKLNEYQRDNLLFVLNLIGYGDKPMWPVCVLNNGDWVGEIAQMLRDSDGSIVAKHPNMDRAWIQHSIDLWVASLNENTASE